MCVGGYCVFRFFILEFKRWGDYKPSRVSIYHLQLYFFVIIRNGNQQNKWAWQNKDLFNLLFFTTDIFHTFHSFTQLFNCLIKHVITKIFIGPDLKIKFEINLQACISTSQKLHFISVKRLLVKLEHHSMYPLAKLNTNEFYYATQSTLRNHILFTEAYYIYDKL